MINKQTLLKINDNTGAKKAKCIKIYKNKTGKIGTTILISIKSIRINKNKKIKIKKGDKVKALIMHTRFFNKNTLGNRIKFDNNNIILLDNQEKPLGTRIFGPITSEFRKSKKLKILSLASNIL